ncbi:transcriptional regulatory protein [Actinosynnema pretiosum subsp. pretiosum]|nr:transcriptional regulatory protein [Actinosynnema pretiosum subsp. pretiosum]
MGGRVIKEEPLMRRLWPVLATAVLVLASGCGGGDGRLVAIASDGRDQAELALLSGATTIVVRAADLGDELVRAWAPDGSKLAPRANVDGGVVRVSFEDRGGSGTADARVEVNRSVLWKVRLDGGAVEQTVDLGAARVSSVDFGAGSQRVDLTLPEPSGAVPVRVTGGASTFAVHLPTGAEARVRFGGGAGQAVIDGATTSGIAGGTVLGTGGVDSAGDHYAVDAIAGVGLLTVDRGARG